MSVRIKNLTYSYIRSDTNVLDNLDLEIEDGQIVLLLGLNGCGKTTLLKNIAGLLRPTSGSIFIDDINIMDMSIRERSKHISYVSQKVNNLEDVKILDYLTFSFTNDLRFYERPSEEMISKAREYASKFNISHLLDKSIDEISGGERQIVSICGALLQNTNMILLDEPTSALDLVNQNNVLKILKNIAREENKTIILSSHNPNHGLYLESFVILMKDGRVYNKGLALDVIKPEILREVYGDNICFTKELPYEEVGFRNEG